MTRGSIDLVLEEICAMVWYASYCFVCMIAVVMEGKRVKIGSRASKQTTDPQSVPNSNRCKYELNALSSALIKLCVFDILKFIMCR